MRDETLGVELPQRAVEVVRAAHRPARLHPGEARHRGARERAELLGVHAHERVEEHLREILVGELAHRAAGVHLVAELVEVGLRVGTELAGFAFLVDTGAEDREVHLEHRVEHAVVAVILHERRADRGPERFAVLERHMLDHAHRVEILRHRHGQAREPQLVHEALQHVEHRRFHRRGAHAFTRFARAVPAQRVVELLPLNHPRLKVLYRRDAGETGASTPSSFRALVMSVWYLSSTCNVSPITSGVISCRPR